MMSEILDRDDKYRKRTAPTELYQTESSLYDEAGHLTSQGKIVAETVNAAEKSGVSNPELTRQRSRLEESRVGLGFAATLASIENHDRSKALDAPARKAKKLHAAANKQSDDFLDAQLHDLKS